MKSLFRFLIPLLPAVMLAFGATTGCDSDSGENADWPAIPPGEEYGQSDYERQAEPGARGPQPRIGDAELEKAAAARVAIDKSNEQLQQAVQQTQDPTEVRKLQLAANERMVQAVENAGLDFEAYNRIMETIRQDPELSARFQQKVQDMK